MIGCNDRQAQRCPWVPTHPQLSLAPRPPVPWVTTEVMASSPTACVRQGQSTRDMEKVTGEKHEVPRLRKHRENPFLSE